MKKLYGGRKIVFFLSAAFIVVFLGIFVFRNAMSIAPPGTTAAKVTFGHVSEEAYEGFFWRVPFCSYPVIVNTRQQTNLYESREVKTRDLQTIGLDCTVIYQINSEKVPAIIKNVNPEKIDSVVLFPRLANALQETIGKNDVYLLVTQQEMVREATRYILTDMLATDGFITVKDILFSKPKFSPQFEKVIEERMIAGQLLEITRIETQKVEEEAKQLLLKASADLDVLKRKNQLLTNPLIIKYEAMKLLQNWNGNLPSTLVISGNESLLPVFPVNSPVKP